MTQFHDMCMYTLALFKIVGVRQGLKEEREGVVISKYRVFKHVGVYIERGVRDVGMREGFNESVANENMGSGELGEEGGERRVQ